MNHFKIGLSIDGPTEVNFHKDKDGNDKRVIENIKKLNDAGCRFGILSVITNAHKGYAQQAIQLAEEIHGSSGWALDTILQEKGNCYLYEKMGYRQTGEAKVINERMTLVFYKKG